MSLNTHKIISGDGEHFHLSLTEPSANHAQPVIVCLPAMGVPARKYQLLAETINQQGWASALFELRGIDSSSVRASRSKNFGYHEILNVDLPAAMAFIRQHYPKNPLYLLGHSLGGQLGLIYMGLNPQSISGFIGIATGTPYFKGWRFPHNVNIFLLSKFMRMVSLIIGHYPGRKLGFGGREARQLVKDWSHSVTSGKYRVNTQDDQLEAKIQQLTKPAIMLTIENDFFAPPNSTKNLAAKLVNGEVTYHHLGSEDFTEDSLGHFNWMKEPEPVVKKIAEWVQRQHQ